MAAELALVVILWSVLSRAVRKNESCASGTSLYSPLPETARYDDDLVIFVILGGCC
jgi:hypothetical protein